MSAIPNATILTPAQIAYYAQIAGFDGQDLQTAVAIALAESSGNPNVYNPETGASGGTPAGQGSYGLWQIYLKEHPEFAADNLYDPQTNANDAYEVYSKAGGFTPWATYNSGAYQEYLGVAAPAPQPAVPGLTSTVIDPATGVAVTPPVGVGISMTDFFWIGGALLAGWVLFSLLD
jgi:lysozyme-like protein